MKSDAENVEQNNFKMCDSQVSFDNYSITKMEKRLLRYQSDNKKLTEQLNCLISLVKRSWSGDKNATFHLSKIIGIEAPTDKPCISPNSKVAEQLFQFDKKTMCERNWERLSAKLLEKHYTAIQAELRDYQKRYLENRKEYMDAVLLDHQHHMSKVSLHKKSGSSDLVAEIDRRFIKHNKSLERMGIPKRQLIRSFSAGYQRNKSSSNKQAVKNLEFPETQLVGDTQPSSSHFVDSQRTMETKTLTPSTRPLRPFSSPNPNRRRHSYNDPSRYAQDNLFQSKETDGPTRTRPISASVLHDGDVARSRPKRRSSKPEIETSSSDQQNTERPLKYESIHHKVRPKSGKLRRKTGRKIRRNSQHESECDEIENQLKDSTTNLSEVNISSSEDVNDEESSLASKPPIAIRVKSASTKRPTHIEEFENDELALKRRENEFLKNVQSLQKKLGIDNVGMVLVD